MNGGNYVNELEFVKELISLLNESDKRNIIKQAAARGFEVHGFSNKPYTAPKNIINSSLMRRNKKNISNYFLILDVINKFPLEQAEDKELIKLAKEWINNEKDRSNIENNIKKHYLDISNEYINSNDMDALNNSLEGGDLDSQTQNELAEKNTILQTKNKELKEKLKSCKIEMDNLRKDFNICMKEEKKHLSEINSLHKLIDEYSIAKKELEKQLQENRSYSVDLLSQVEELNYYKDNALKIACFVKDNQGLQLNGYNITFFNEWSDQIKEKIDSDSYSEVWYVHEGFNYSYFLEIKKFFKCTIREYISIKKLMNGV